MSDGGESPFARWSRRKQATREAGVGSRDEGLRGAESGAAEANVGNSGGDGGQVPAVERPAEGPAEPLPSLESLTAECDLAAFLREGVPEALKKAALRKMWSLDPAIRDHVGPAECDWDFNLPDSIPGFGSIGPAPIGPGFFSRPVAGDVPGSEVPAPSAEPGETVAAPEEKTGPDAAPDTPPQEDAAPDTCTRPDKATETVSRTAGRHGSALPGE